MCERNGILYNPPEFEKIVSQNFSYSVDDREALQNLTLSQKVLISCEGLVDWNPRNWEGAAERLLDLFGSQIQVVITIRDPIDYLTSVYVQKIQEGNIMRPHDFFVTSKEYKSMQPFLSERRLERFDVDSFDLDRLIATYKKRFESVHVLPLTKINMLYPWIQIFGIASPEADLLKGLMNKSKRLNVSYSKRAMHLTFVRERWLNKKGLRSVSSSDLPTTISDGEHLKLVANLQPFSCLNLFQKIIQFPMRATRILKSPWRSLMQGVVDRMLPSEKYTLPLEIKFDEDLIARNIKTVRRAEKQIDILTNGIS